ncbi:MAG: PhnB protein [Thermoanaerobaculia bacterium]|jgi:PhnB protein|nr:PhnB protein [Thermoanaerobaculia bacterium]
MAQISAYLFFNNTCGEAMRFYADALGGKLDLIPASQTPAADQMPAGAADAIIHARLELPGGGTLMASDWMDTAPYQPMQGCAISLVYSNADEAKRVYELLIEGGKAPMPFAKTFFAEGFGMLTDRFGTAWMVSGGMVN